MRPFVPTIVALLAVLGLLVPPTTLCHAHEGGHEVHAHAPAHTVHVPRPHSHGNGAAHVHPHPGTPDLPEDEPGDPPVDRDAPEGHTHAADGVEAIAQRSRDAAARATAGPAERPLARVVTWAVPMAEPRGPVPRADVAWPGCSRPKDRLVLLGSLRF